MQAKRNIFIIAIAVASILIFVIFKNSITQKHDSTINNVSATKMTDSVEPFTDEQMESNAFPATFEHKYGTTTITKQPIRVASLDWTGADDLLALGVQPVVVREWLCSDEPYAVCPWAQPLLTSEPLVVGTQINYEAIAATNPDVIIALWASISEQDYQQLSKIAPVIATPQGIRDNELTWEDRAILTGRAVGKENLAKSKVKQVSSQLNVAAKPQWQGKTAAIGFVSPSAFGVIANDDPSMQLLRRLGFRLPDSLINEASKVDFLPLSAEEINRLDADILIWVNPSMYEQIKTLAGRNLLKAHQEGREIFLDKDSNDALRQATLLSIPFVVDNLVPQIDAVLKD